MSVATKTHRNAQGATFGQALASPVQGGTNANKALSNVAFSFEDFYATYYTNLKKADERREEYKKTHPEWNNVFDDDLPHPEKGLSATSTADRNVYVRCRRLRAYARFIVENVTEHEAQEYVTQALTLELQSASNAENNEFPFPPQVINEVVQYVQSRGKRSGLTEDYYDLQGDKWVLLDKAPDFSEDRREGAKDPPHIEDSRKSETEAPDFIAHICNGNSRFENLFEKMLADPLDDPAAKEYDAIVNAKVQEEAKARNFAGDARLPLSTIRQIVMSCAHLEHSKAIIAKLAGRGADLVDGDGNRLPDGEDVYNTWSKHFHDLLDSKGYPPEWIKHFNRTVPGLAARRGKDSPYTIEEIQRVASQHGEPMTESVYTRQLQERDSAIKSSETPLTAEADARKRKRRGSSPDGDGDSPAHKRLDDRSSTEPRSPHDVSSNEPSVEGESLNNANGPQSSPTSAEAQTTDRDAAMGEGGIPPTAEESSSQVRNEVFTDPDRQEGKIGGFRVASKKRDGTECYQVLVEVGIYNQGRITLWHIKAATMYRESLVDEYKDSRGIEITTADGNVAEFKKHPFNTTEISGIAMMPRTTGKNLKKMPTMFIRLDLDDGQGPRFWSRSYMGKVWGVGPVSRKIRDLMKGAGMPSVIVPEGASRRTCRDWGVEYKGPIEELERGETLEDESGAELDRNDGVYDEDGGFVVPGEVPPLERSSKELLRADKERRLEELRVKTAMLEKSLAEETET